MAQPIIQPSFSSGEISPTLYARVDLAKYKIGAALMRNMFVDYRGGASNRPGTKFVGQCKSSTFERKIPFQFSTIQAYALEFTDQAIRVIKDGAYVTETSKTITGITQAGPGVITSAAHGFSNGDWVYLSTIVGMTQLNTRTVIVSGVTANTFTVIDPIVNTTISTTAYGAYVSGGSAARIYTITTPYLAADIPTLKFTQSADVMTLVHPNYRPRELTRTGHASWTLSVIVTSTPTNPPATLTITPTAISNKEQHTYVITTIDKEGNESAPSVPSFANSANTKVTGGGNIQITWSPVVNADYYIVYKAPVVFEPNGIQQVIPPNVNSLFGYMSSTKGTVTNDSNILQDFSKTPPIIRDPFSPGQVTAITVTAAGAGYTGVPTVAITGGEGSGATARAVVDPIAATIMDIIIINPGSGYTSAPAVGITGGAGAGAAATATIGAQTGIFPSTVAYFQQRRVFAASTEKPITFWMTQPARHSNFNVTNPSRDDDAITGTLVSLQVNAVKHLIPMPGGLIALTSFGAWQITGGGQSTPITPASAQAQAQAYNGANDLAPIIINYDILYVQAKGSIVRDLSYSYQINIYTGSDITVMSNHFFYGYTLVSWSYAESPNKLVWVVRSDGKALTLTYLKEQEVLGWASHDTDGLFISCCSISEGNEDVTYFTVQRLVQGQNVLYTERLASRQFNGNIANAWFLDCALQTTFGSPVTTISGLWHLEGRTVTVFGDGLAQALTRVVTNGAITIVSALGVLVGLPYTAQLQTLSLDTSEPTIQGKRKQVFGLTTRIAESTTFKVGPTFDAARLQNWINDVQVFNGTVSFGLLTGDYRRSMGQGWNVQGQICFQQDKPYPMTILGVIPEIGVGDTK